jgi:hypothetical protein
LVCPGLYCLTSELVPRVDSSAGAHAQFVMSAIDSH